MTTDLIRALAESVRRDDDTGNTIVYVQVEAGERLGFCVERIAQTVPGAPLQVQASRRSVAGAILDRLEEL